MATAAKNKLGWLLLACLAATIGQGLWTAARGETFATLNARELRRLITKHQGQVVVVNFWASWCPPCRKEFGDIIKVYDDYRSKGLQVIAVSMNADDELEDIDKFLKNFKPTFPIYRSATQDDTFYKGIEEKWLGEIPVTMVFDTAGKPIHFHKKQVTYEELVKEVTPLLPAPAR